MVPYRRPYAGGVPPSLFVQEPSVFCLILAENASGDLLSDDENTGAEVTLRTERKSQLC